MKLRPGPFRSAAAAAVVLLAVWLLAGCAPRYLIQTPLDVARYPFQPVSPEAVANAKAVLAINPQDPQAPFSQFVLALDAFNRQAWPQSLKAIQELRKRYPDSEWRPAADLLAARCQVQLKNPLAALSQLNALARTPIGREPVFAAAIREESQRIINDELDLPALANVQTDYPGTPYAEQAQFVTGKRLLDAGQPDPAVGRFREFLAKYPESEFAPLARELMAKAVQLVPVNRLRIGCLLPVSGPYAPYGQAIQRGLELALKQINQQRSRDQALALSVIDSEASTLEAVAGLQKLAEVDKVLVIIGPALSASARALLPELERWRLPLISPSASDADLAGKSPYFFRYLLTTEQQGEAMAEFVVLHENLKRIGILHAADRYDRSLADAFATKAQQLGGEVVARGEYAPGTTDFKDNMLALGGLDPSIMKNDELEERKALDRGLENVAYDIAGRLAPQALIASQTPIPSPKATPIPSVGVAILRFTEPAGQTQNAQVGRMITEHFSYALAAKPGLEVLTQRLTLEKVRSLGLAPEAVGPADAPRLGEALGVPYLVQGELLQKPMPAPVATPAPDQPVPVTYTLTLRLIEAHSGRELKHYVQDWVKHLPPTADLLKQVDAIYLPVSLEDALLIAPQLTFYDLNSRLFGSDAWVAASQSRAEGTESLKGAVAVTGFWPEDPDPLTQEFVHQYEATFSESPSYLAAQAYDTLRLVAKVMGDLPGTAGREDVAARLHQVKEFPGVTGSAWVEPDGEVRRTPCFLIYQNSQWQRIK